MLLMASSPTTFTPIQDSTFQQFLHDVHHAYLLLHRAISQTPPTLIPNLEPMPLPSPGNLDQPEGFQPRERFFAATRAYIDGVEFPPARRPEQQR